MILCTLGTHPQPFERALDWVLPLAAGEPLVVQHGATPPRPGAAGVEWHRFLNYDDLTRLMDEASVVVCHAGVGTVMSAIEHGQTPVVIPRLAEHGEHVDDHQLQITRALGEAGYVVPCTAAGALAAAIAEAKAARGRLRKGGGELRAHAVRAAGGDPARLAG